MSKVIALSTATRMEPQRLETPAPMIVPNEQVDVTAANREKILAYAARPDAQACLDALPPAGVVN